MRKKIELAGFLMMFSTSLLAQEQVISPTPANLAVGSGAAVSFDVMYSTANPVDETLTGLGLKMHFNSSQVTFNSISNVLNTDLLAQGSVENDSSNLDNDPTTDKLINVAWTSFTGAWPGAGTTPIRLYSANFTTAANFSGTATIRFSGSPAAGRSLATTPVVLTGQVASQIVTAEPATQTVSVDSGFSVGVQYSTANPVDATLAGLGLRIHFNSAQATFNSLTSVLAQDLLVQGNPEADTLNFDGDASTNTFVNVAWASFTGTWPGGDGNAFLYYANFTPVVTGTTNVNFSASSVASGRTFQSTGAVVTVNNVVNQPPSNVSITLPGGGSNLTLNQGSTVTLQGAGTDPEGQNVTFAWNFGGAAPNSTQQNPTVTFNTAGTFTITLVVIDPQGASTQATATVTVNAIAVQPVEPIPTLSEWMMLVLSILLAMIALSSRQGFFIKK